MAQGSNGPIGKEVKDGSSFNMAHWRHIMPNIGSGAPNFSNGAPHRQHMQAQQRGRFLCGL